MAGIKPKPKAATDTESRLAALLPRDTVKAPKLEVAPRVKAGEAPAPSARAGAPVARAKGKTAPVAVPSPPPVVSEGGKPAPFGKARTRSVGISLGDKSLPMKKMDAWSYSRLADWETCPLKAKLKHVDKIKEPGSQAMERGSMIHKLAEDFANGTTKVLAPELARFKPQFMDLKKQKPICEEQWAFMADWTPTGWFGGPWLRVKTDVSFKDAKGVAGTIIDHKTGKEKDEHDDQLSLYAVSFFSREPKLETVSSQLWYLDHGTMRDLDFTRDQLPLLQEYWNDRVRPMMEDTRFPARPNRLCQWCFFRASNGGSCKF